MRRRAAGLLGAAALFGALCMPGAAAARTPLDAVPDTGASAGLVASAALGAPALRHADRAVQRDGLPYQGGQVLHSSRVHAIFWTPTGSGLSFPPAYVTLVKRFLRDVAHDSHLPTNVFSLSGQYGDADGRAVYQSVFAGAVHDTDPLPPTRCQEPVGNGPGWTVCVTDAEIQAEIEHVVAAHHLTHGATDIFLLVMPEGLGSCFDTGPSECALGGKSSGSYCGYHSLAGPHELLYALIPFNGVDGHCQSNNPRPNRNPVDPALSTISHELNETITDPYGDAWVNSQGSEEADLCLSSFGHALGGSAGTAYNELINGHRYYLQGEWSNWVDGCAQRAQPDRLAISVGAPTRVGMPAALRAEGSAAHGDLIGFQWQLGRQGSAQGVAPAPVFHRPGRFLIRVRSTDSAGLWTFATRTLTVL